VNGADPPLALPTQYDGTQFVVHAVLPAGKTLARADVYGAAYGIRLDDGAKPWPYCRDARTGAWFSLSVPTPDPLDALVWMIDLGQLLYRSREAASDFLNGVLPELADAAARFGARAVPESDVPTALTKMSRVEAWLRVRDREAVILITAPNGGAFAVRGWWRAFVNAGMVWGDGDLFWAHGDGAEGDEAEDGNEELFHAEPFSTNGYFHRSDLNSEMGFPDAALRFRLRDAPDAVARLREMARVAAQVAGELGADLKTTDGKPFRLADEEAKARREWEEVHSLPPQP
jgi:hypothetical protein